MGTSSARRAPTTRLWRQAKGAATRYLSPPGAGAVTAGEVAARYLAALGEGEQGPLAAWRLTRKVAQDLGALAALTVSQGWEDALSSCGLWELAGYPPEVAAQGVSSVLVGAGGGLEEAVARLALLQILLDRMSSTTPAAAGRLEPRLVVPQFLATALYLGLALDLGEPLEAAAANLGQLRKGLDDLQGLLAQAASAAAPEAPHDPQAWQGLAGWTWVTEVMEALITRLTEPV